MQKLMHRDMQRYLIALDNAGVIKGFNRTSAGGYKVDRVINKEAIRALSDRYDESVTMLQGAAELGLSVEQFENVRVAVEKGTHLVSEVVLMERFKQSICYSRIIYKIDSVKAFNDCKSAFKLISIFLYLFNYLLTGIKGY